MPWGGRWAQHSFPNAASLEDLVALMLFSLFC